MSTRPLPLAYGVELTARARRAALRQPDRCPIVPAAETPARLCFLHQPPDDSGQRPRTLRQISPRLPRLRPCRSRRASGRCRSSGPSRIASSVNFSLGASASRSGPTRATAFAALSEWHRLQRRPNSSCPCFSSAREVRSPARAGCRRCPRSLAITRAGTATPSTSSDSEERERGEAAAAARLRVQHRTEAAAPAAHGEQQRPEAQARRRRGRRTSDVLTGRAIVPAPRRLDA